MAVKIGEFRKKRPERITFRDWIMKGYSRSGDYPVLFIFPPNRFPTFSLVFEDDVNQLQVKISLPTQRFKEVLSALGIELKRADLPSLTFQVQDDEDGIIYSIDKGFEGFRLVWHGGYWRLEKINDDWDDLKNSF